jgi:ISXO2-like transposase domain
VRRTGTTGRSAKLAEGAGCKGTEPLPAAGRRKANALRFTYSATAATGRLLYKESLTETFGRFALRLFLTSPARLCKTFFSRTSSTARKSIRNDAIGYDKVSYNFVHDVVNHAERYVNGRVHTNGLENFWSLLKRGLRGTYVAVEPFHLFRYVDEQVFRYNNRKDKKDADRFALAMSQVGGRRLTYSELTGKDQSPRHVSTGAGETPVPF